jgi:hypothetical protein
MVEGEIIPNQINHTHVRSLYRELDVILMEIFGSNEGTIESLECSNQMKYSGRYCMRMCVGDHIG